MLSPGLNTLRLESRLVCPLPAFAIIPASLVLDGYADTFQRLHEESACVLRSMPENLLHSDGIRYNTIFYKVCRILGITNMYESYFGVNPADPFSSLTDEGREKAMDYINLLHASGMYEKQTAKIIPFRSIDIFENAVSAGTGNFLVDGPKETVRIDESILPEDTTFGT